RLAVQHDHDRRVARSLVDVVHPHRGRIVVRVYLDVVRLERVAREIGEALVGRAQQVHGPLLPWEDAACPPRRTRTQSSTWPTGCGGARPASRTTLRWATAASRAGGATAAASCPRSPTAARSRPAAGRF